MISTLDPSIKDLISEVFSKNALIDKQLKGIKTEAEKVFTDLDIRSILNDISNIAEIGELICILGFESGKSCFPLPVVDRSVAILLRKEFGLGRDPVVAIHADGLYVSRHTEDTEVAVLSDSAARIYSGCSVKIGSTLYDLSIPQYEISLNLLVQEKASSLFSVYMLGILGELAGICSAVSEMSIDYGKTRKQFDTQIGAFQAIKHKLSDIKLVEEATIACAESVLNKDLHQDYVKLGVRFAAESVPTACETALQIFGGIGFTWEHPLHWYLRRARSIKKMVL